MKVTKFVNTYQGRVLQDADAYKSNDFIAFARAMRATINSELKSIGAKIASFNVGHYDLSGFAEKDGKYIYFSYSEPRHLPIDLNRRDPMMGILIRTADGPKDYRGGQNHFTNIMSFASSAKSLLE